ncbi:hypothetical protein D9M68_488990 [compost metagenome]|uniref:hypothetical protein n=1 Tax=unclassified Achromobacter TaxID=2626865 RepID=UPI001E38860C|nr:hypothetical protein [Achromobacter sp. MY14]MCD0500931.1 hypothetical protein [Achromobacter sp. MY14]
MMQHTTILGLCFLVGVSIAGIVNAGIRGSSRGGFVFFAALITTVLMGILLNSGSFPESSQIGMERLFAGFSVLTAALMPVFSMATAGRRGVVRDLGVCAIFAVTTYFLLWL